MDLLNNSIEKTFHIVRAEMSRKSTELLIKAKTISIERNSHYIKFTLNLLD